jgi:hypothetical protein
MSADAASDSEKGPGHDAIAQEILRAAFAVPEQVETVVVTNRGECVRNYAGDASALPRYPRNQETAEHERTANSDSRSTGAS